MEEKNIVVFFDKNMFFEVSDDRNYQKLSQKKKICQRRHHIICVRSSLTLFFQVSLLRSRAKNKITFFLDPTA